MSDFSENSTKTFFDAILKGESVTYNDHNWYKNGSLKGYIEGRNSQPFSLLNKDLSKYSIQDVMDFQSKSRSSGSGQLWATGRYQIIPNTLKGITTSQKIPLSTKYDKKTQDQLGLALLLQRTNARNYLTKKVDDNKSNLEKASLDVAKIWSSVGVPYAMQGNKQYIQKNQSYYTGGGDKASIKTEDVQEALKKLRKSYGTGKKNKKSIIFLSIFGSMALVGTGLILYYTLWNKKK